MAQSRQRVMIIGQPGSGKSTLARALGPVFNLPVVHIDLIHWQSGWVERSNEEKGALCREVHAREEWIFEGGHSITWPERLDRADTLIWLDIPLRIRAWRVFWRTIKYRGQSRPDLPSGCPEKFNREFIAWIWNTRNTGRQRMLELYNSAPARVKLFRLQSAVAVREFMVTVSTLDNRH